MTVNPCDSRWAIDINSCCGGCRCSPTAITLTPIHSPFGEDMYGVLNNTATSAGGGKVLAVSEDRIPLWKDEFMDLARIIADILRVDLEKITAGDLSAYIQKWLDAAVEENTTIKDLRTILSNLKDRLAETENENEKKQLQEEINEVQMQLDTAVTAHANLQQVFRDVQKELNQEIGSKGKLWFYMNDDTRVRDWDWVCYDDMLGSRFNKTEVLQKYVRRYEDGPIAYMTPREGVTRHLIKSLGPCEMYWREQAPLGSRNCFFSPYNFLYVDGMPDPLPLTAKFEIYWSDHNNAPPLSPNTSAGISWDDGDPLTGQSSRPVSPTTDWSDEQEEKVVEESGSATGSVTFRVPAQIFDVIISDAYHFCFTPKYLEFDWSRRDFTCMKRDENGEEIKSPFGTSYGKLVGCPEYGDADEKAKCIPHVGSFYEAWTGGVHTTFTTYSETVGMIGYEGGIVFPWMGVISVPANYYEFEELRWEKHEEKVGLWGDANKLMEFAKITGKKAYFNCAHPSRWVNMQIVRYPIMPGKKEFSGQSGTPIMGPVLDEDGEGYTNKEVGKEINLDDPWQCNYGTLEWAQKNKIPMNVFKHMEHNVWISAGRAADPTKNVKAVKDKATLVIDKAWAYNYKYETFTNGLLVRQEIKPYAPLPDYPDEVAKRNFQEELKERLEQMKERVKEIDLQLEELKVKIEVFERRMAPELKALEAELLAAEREWDNLEEKYSDIEYGGEEDYDEANKLRWKIQERIRRLTERMEELLAEYEVNYIEDITNRISFINVRIAHIDGRLSELNAISKERPLTSDETVERAQLQTEKGQLQAELPVRTTQFNTVRTLERNINLTRAEEYRPTELQSRMAEIDAEIKTIQNGTPEYRQLVNWRDELEEEKCMLTRSCVEERINKLIPEYNQALRDVATIEGGWNREPITDKTTKMLIGGLTQLGRLQRDYHTLSVAAKYCFGQFSGENCPGKDLQEAIDEIIDGWDDETREKRANLLAFIRDIKPRTRELERELWKFMDEEERINAEIKENEEIVEELREEFDWWHEFIGGKDTNPSKASVTSCNPLDLEATNQDRGEDDEIEACYHIDRFGYHPADFCYWFLYSRTINRHTQKIADLRIELREAKKAKVLDPYIWQFNTYLWSHMIQEGMAFYKMSPEDTVDPDIKLNPRKGLTRDMIKGWGKGRGINYRTNWDFSWARGHRMAGTRIERHCIQTSRRRIGLAQCLLHYVDLGAKGEDDAVDTKIGRLEEQISDLRRRLNVASPGSVEASQLQIELNKLLNEVGIAMASPEDEEYKRKREWGINLIPLADYKPFGIVGKTILSRPGGSAPVPPIIAIYDESGISDWRKGNDPQIKDMYDVKKGEGVGGTTVYEPKEGTNLIHNLIEPNRVLGYNLVKDTKFKWQRKRFVLVTLEDGTPGYEEQWENDPDREDVTEFLVWYDGTSFIQKPYLPDERLGGLLYKTESHKYVPTLAQRAPTGFTHVKEEITIHNAYFLNRRQAFGSVECGEGLLKVTFLTHNHPINNPAPRGQLPFWHGDIQFAPDHWTERTAKDKLEELVEGQDWRWDTIRVGFDKNGKPIMKRTILVRREYRDVFIATKGDSGWLCRENDFEPISDEIQSFRGIWWHNGYYYVKNDYNFAQVMPTDDGFLLKWHNETITEVVDGEKITRKKYHPWNTTLGSYYDENTDTWELVPWSKPVRATVFLGPNHDAILGQTFTSGSTWRIQGIFLGIKPRELFPISELSSFTDALDELERKLDDVWEEYVNIFNMQPVVTAAVRTQLLALYEQIKDLEEQIEKKKEQEPPPLILFNLLRPTAVMEIKEIDNEIVELERKIAVAERERRFGDVILMTREVDKLRALLTDENNHNICVYTKPIAAAKSTPLRAGINYTILRHNDKIKRLQLVDGIVFILTVKGDLLRGKITTGDKFEVTTCTIEDRCTFVNNEESYCKPILDFWMETASKGRIIYGDLYETGRTIQITGGPNYKSEEQRIDKAIDDEPYDGTSCNLQLFDSPFNNPTALVNYKGLIWRLEDKQWRYVDRVPESWMTARWNKEFSLSAECADESNSSDLSGNNGPLMLNEITGEHVSICNFSAEWTDEFEVEDQEDSENLPPHNLNYDSHVGDGDFKPSDLVGAQNVSDLDMLVRVIKTGATHSDLSSVNELAIFGSENSKFFDQVMRGLALTPSNLQFEYIDSVRDLLMMELIYNKYFYVKATRSLWEYNGKSWLEFLKFTSDPIPVKSKGEFVEMKKWLDSTGCTGIPNYALTDPRHPDYPPEPNADGKMPKDDCCRRCEEERKITDELENVTENEFLVQRVAALNKIFNTSYGVGDIDRTVREFMNILTQPRHPNYPKGVCPDGYSWSTSLARCLDEDGYEWTEERCPEGYTWHENARRCLDSDGRVHRWEEILTPEDQVDRAMILINQITEHLREESSDIKQVQYLLTFTSDLIRMEMIPRWGEQEMLLDLMGQIERYKKRTAIELGEALGFYYQAYSICESLMGGMHFDMSAGDFFEWENPCVKIRCDNGEDVCKECNPKRFENVIYLGIIDIFHKPRSDDRQARRLNFVPGENGTKDIIVHADKWSRNQGDTWLEWDNCIGECTGCKASAADVGDRRDSIEIGTNKSKIWADSPVEGAGHWIFEYKIDDSSAWSLISSQNVWSAKGEWWYDFWSIDVDEIWWEREYDKIRKGIEAGGADAAYWIEVERHMGSGLHHLMTLTGRVRKEVRVNLNAPPLMHKRDFVIRLSPPPNMLRDNTETLKRIDAQIAELAKERDMLDPQLDKIRLQEVRDTIEGLVKFRNELPLSTLYHEEYQFKIMLVDGGRL